MVIKFNLIVNLTLIYSIFSILQELSFRLFTSVYSYIAIRR